MAGPDRCEGQQAEDPRQIQVDEGRRSQAALVSLSQQELRGKARTQRSQFAHSQADILESNDLYSPL